MVLQQIILTARYLEPLLVTLLPRLIALHLLKFLLFRPRPVVETVTVGDDLVGIGMMMMEVVMTETVMEVVTVMMGII